MNKNCIHTANYGIVAVNLDLVMLCASCVLVDRRFLFHSIYIVCLLYAICLKHAARHESMHS